MSLARRLTTNTLLDLIKSILTTSTCSALLDDKSFNHPLLLVQASLLFKPLLTLRRDEQKI